MESRDELNEQSMTMLKGIIEDKIALLEKQLEAEKQSAKPVDLETPIGRLSRMDAIQQQQMATASKKRSKSQLEALKAALKRFDGGTYGLCLECGNPISLKRLKIKPEATLCIHCQKR